MKTKPSNLSENASDFVPFQASTDPTNVATKAGAFSEPKGDSHV